MDDLPLPPREIPTIHAQRYYSISDADDKVIAHCNVAERHGVLMVSNIWVDGAHRRKGLGTALMERAIDDWGTCDLYLLVASYTDRSFNDPDLVKWYSKFGFRMTAFPGGMYRRGQARDG